MGWAVLIIIFLLYIFVTLGVGVGLLCIGILILLIWGLCVYWEADAQKRRKIHKGFLISSLAGMLILIGVGLTMDTIRYEKRNKYIQARSEILYAAAQETVDTMVDYEYVDYIEITNKPDNGQPFCTIYINIELNSSFNWLSPKRKYEYLSKLKSEIHKTRDRAIYRSNRDEFNVCGGVAVKEAFNGYSFPTEKIIYGITCGEELYKVDIDKLYDSNGLLYDANPPKKEVTEEKKENKKEKPYYYGGYGKKNYDRDLSFDPDDYDDPEEYADDAWGIDFDDWDDAYDFWEDW